MDCALGRGGRALYRWDPQAGLLDLAMATAADIAGTSPVTLLRAAAKAASAAEAARAADKMRAARDLAAAADVQAAATSSTSAGGPALSTLLHPASFGAGARVRRGRDWEAGNSVVGADVVGTVVDTWERSVLVQWPAAPSTGALGGITFLRYDPFNGPLSLEQVSAPPLAARPRIAVGDLVRLRAGALAALLGGDVDALAVGCMGDASEIIRLQATPALGVVVAVSDGLAVVSRVFPQPRVPLKADLDFAAEVVAQWGAVAVGSGDSMRRLPADASRSAAASGVKIDVEFRLNDARHPAASDRAVGAATDAPRAFDAAALKYFAPLPAQSSYPTLLLDAVDYAFPASAAVRDRWLPGAGLFVGCEVTIVPRRTMDALWVSSRSSYDAYVKDADAVFIVQELNVYYSTNGGDGLPLVKLVGIFGSWERSSLQR